MTVGEDRATDDAEEETGVEEEAAGVLEDTAAVASMADAGRDGGFAAAGECRENAEKTSVARNARNFI